jgi:hypothetical protein
MIAHDHVDARRDHRCGMDERAHGRGTFHRVRQPRVQRNLRRFPDGPDQEAQGDCSGHLGGQVADLGEDFRIVERLEIEEDQEDRQQESGVADAIDDEGFRRRLGRRHLVIVVADQQIGAEPDAFPADEEHRVVVAHHQQEHRDHEQIHVCEEPRKPLLSMHVAD